jgi:hypothetical protein
VRFIKALPVHCHVSAAIYYTFYIFSLPYWWGKREKRRECDRENKSILKISTKENSRFIVDGEVDGIEVNQRWESLAQKLTS